MIWLLQWRADHARYLCERAVSCVRGALEQVAAVDELST